MNGSAAFAESGIARLAAPVVLCWLVPTAATKSRKSKTQPRCDDCFFRCNLLCALELEKACPTFRPDRPEGLQPPRQLKFTFRTEERTNTAWTFPNASEQAALHS